MFNCSTFFMRVMCVGMRSQITSKTKCSQYSDLCTTWGQYLLILLIPTSGFTAQTSA